MKQPLITAVLALAAVASAQAQERTVRGVLGIGVTGGGDTLATVVYNDGSTDSIRAGGLVHLYGGAEFRVAPQFTVQTNIGYHVDRTSGYSNGSLRFSRTPIELLGHFEVAPSVRLGGGARFVNNAKIDSSGVLSGARVDFDNTVGAVIEAEWLVLPSLGLKVRYVSERYKVNGFTADGNHGGFYVSWYL